MVSNSSIKQIDGLLNYLYSDRGNSSFESILSGLNAIEESKDIAGDELLRMLNKLIRDGFVHFEDIPAGYDDPFTKAPIKFRRYSISFDGKLFIEQGGYTQQAIRRNAESIRVETLERFQKATADRMTYLTIILAAGALIAALYYLVELYWKYHWFH